MEKKSHFGLTLIVFLVTSFCLNAQKMYTKKVASSGDDIEIYTTSTGSITSTTLELHGKVTTQKQETFVRFTNVSLPVDAIINSVKLVFYATSNGNGTKTVLQVLGEKGNAAAYPASLNSTVITQLNNRLYTTPISWEQSSAIANQANKSPDLKTMVATMFPTGLNNVNLSFRIKGDEQGNFTAWSYNGNTGLAPTLEIDYYSNIYSYNVTSDLDDIEEVNPPQNTFTNNNTLRLGGYTSTSTSTTNKIKQGIRFNNIVIPPTAEIADAYIEFTVKQTSTNQGAVVTIKAEKGNATAFKVAANELSKRKYTAVSLNWTPERFATGGQKVRTPNLKNLIDENRLNGWQSGQSLAFLLDGNKFIGDVHSRNGSSTLQPQLVIRTIDNGNGPSLTDVITDPLLMTQIYINEISSKGTLTEKEDWIELYNAHNQPVWIKDKVYISNSNDNPTKHELKNIIIPANGRVVLITDNIVVENNHVNFKLANENTRLYLSKNVNGEISLLDEINYTAMVFGQSFGRKTDGSAEFVAFNTDSYDAPNATGTINIPLSLSHTRGVYETNFNLNITLPQNTVIRYTLDGVTTPSKTVGVIYNGTPIPINKTTAVKIFAYSTTETNANSGVITHSFVLKNNFANELINLSQWNNKSKTNASEYAQAVGQIPIVSITTSSEPTASYKYATFEYIDKHVNANNSNFYSSMGVKKFGQESINFFNPNLKFKFNNDYGTAKAEYPFFDILPYDNYPAVNKISRLELKEGQDGPSRNVYGLGYARLSEKLMMNLQKQMGKYALNTKFVHLFINGKWRGLKTMRDDFAQQNVEEYFGDDDANYTKVSLQDLDFTKGVVETGEGSAAVWNNARALATPATFQQFKEKVDVDDYIKFMVQFMMFDMEEEAVAIGHNAAPLYSKFRFMINDTDGAVNNSTIGGFQKNYVRRWSTPGIGIKGPGGMFTALTGTLTGTMGNLEFKTLVKDAVLTHIGPAKAPWAGTLDAALSVSNITAKVHSLVAELDVLYKVDAAYMGFANNVYELWKNQLYPRIIAETPARVKFNLEKWLSIGLAHTLDYVTINSNQEITPTTAISFTSPNAAATLVYYTKDGSDPMGNDGAVSPRALQYTAAFNLPLGNYTIVTRAFTANNWGPISYKAIQVVPPAVGKLVISGINYKPQTNSDAEFLLITNAGNATLDLTGYNISDAITYTFPVGTTMAQGQTIMLAKNLSLITGFTSLTKYQWTSGSLNNSGEAITFKDSTGFVADQVSYLSVAPWATQANGLGYYLKLINNNSDNTLPINWEAVEISTSLVNTLPTETISTIKSEKVLPPTSYLKEENKQEVIIKIYPNPVTTDLAINLGNSAKAQVLIYDLKGILAIANDINESNATLHVSYLKAGTYLVKVILDNGFIYSQRIVKE